MNKKSIRQPRYDLIAAGILFLGFTAYFSYGVVQEYLRQEKASRAFLPVAATVVSAKVETRGSNSATHGISYLPQIVYRYSVEGKEFESKLYAFISEGKADLWSAQAIVDKYSVGTVTEAYFNPQNPSQAVLDPSAPNPRIFLFLTPFLLLSSMAIYLGIRGRTES